MTIDQNLNLLRLIESKLYILYISNRIRIVVGNKKEMYSL